MRAGTAAKILLNEFGMADVTFVFSSGVSDLEGILASRNSNGGDEIQETS